MNGILLLDKPKGISSHDCVNAVRKKFGTKKVGHAGTLDPLATGLLVMAVGFATRFLQYLNLEPKRYFATFQLGVETDTYDLEGDVIARCDATHVSLASIESALLQFTGDLSQIPPMFSAVKIDGQPLYKRARAGETIARAPRPVTVTQFKIASFSPPMVEAEISCSSGTYVRSLVHDLGVKLGVGACLTELRRTGVGEFHVEHAARLDAVEMSQLIPLKTALQPMPMLSLSPENVKAARLGQQLPVGGFEAEKIGFLDENGELFAIARAVGNETWNPECVIPSLE